MAATEGFELIVSEEWAAAYPGACLGTLAMAGVRNPAEDDRMTALLDETAAGLTARHAAATRADLLARPELATYAAHYRKFDKTYHVLLQLESVVLKGKPIRARGALVAAMFRAELTTGLLTAGHDAGRLDGRLTIGVVAPGDRYLGFGGREIEAAPGDMCIRDGTAIVSSVIYGPDDRTRLEPDTQIAVFTTYAPAGIGPGAVARHMATIAEGVRAVAPEATIETLAVAVAEAR